MRKSRLQILTEISKANDLQIIINLCYELFGNPLIIMDSGMEPIAMCTNYPPESQAEIDELIGGQRKLKNIYQNVEIRKSSKNNQESDESYICRDENIPYGRIVKNITDGGRSIGTVVMVEYFKKFDRDDLQYMELITSFIALPIRKSQYKIYGEWSLQQFMAWLLSGNKVSVGMMDERASFRQNFQKKYFYLLSIYTVDEENGEESLAKILDELSTLGNSYAMIYKSRILLLYNCDEKISSWQQKVPDLHKIMEKWNLYSCVSQSFTSYDELYENYLKTDDMIEKACILRRRERYFDFNKQIFYQMLDRVPEGVDLRAFCDERILDIEEYDKKHRTDLIPTLHTYLENVKSLTRTSEILFIHKNTANYRINKCMELADCTFEHGDEIFAAIYSLRIIEYCNRRQGVPYEEESE